MYGFQHAERCSRGLGAALRHTYMQAACRNYARPVGRTDWEGKYAAHGVANADWGSSSRYYDFGVSASAAGPTLLCDNSLVAVPMGGDMDTRLNTRCAEKVAEFAKPCRDVGARFLPLIMSSDGDLHASTRNFVERDREASATPRRCRSPRRVLSRAERRPSA